VEYICKDVEVGLVIKAAWILKWHGAANLFERLGNRFSLPAKLEKSFGQIRRLGLGAVKIIAVAACALGLISAFSVFRLLGGEYACRN
jgi:ABC-type transporter Mla maintaining outer membrane lipid asymmetry permease subunit MlaE